MGAISDAERITIEAHAKRIFERTVGKAFTDFIPPNDKKLHALARNAYRAAECFVDVTKERGLK